MEATGLASTIVDLGAVSSHAWAWADSPWFDIVANAVVGLSFLSVPVTLNRLLSHRQGMLYARALRFFAAVILGCGSFLALYHSVFPKPGLYIEEAVEVLTAVAALGTALCLWVLTRSLRNVPTPAVLAAMNQEMADRLSETSAAFKALQESNRLLTLAEEMAQVGHFRFAADGRRRFWSAGLKSTFGLSPTDEVPGFDADWNGYHGEDRSRVRTLLFKAIEQVRDFSFEAKVQRPDGSLRSVSVKGVCERDAEGRTESVFGVCVDMTEAFLAQERIRNGEAFLDRAGRIAGIGAWEVDLRSNSLRWSPLTRMIHQVDPGYGLTMEDFFSFYGQPARKLLKQAFDAAVTAGTPWDMELPLTSANGQRKWVRSAGEVECEGATPIRVFGVVQDISERKRIEIEREGDRMALEQARASAEASRAKAEEASVAKTQFLAAMSHEIRTPLNSIVGYTELLLDGARLGVDDRRKLERVQTSATALLSVVNDVLDFSKIEAGKVELRREPFRVAELADEALSMVASQAMQKDILLNVNVCDSLPDFVVGDPDRLRQVLVNLLGNAVKFTSHGSVDLWIQCTQDEDARDYVRFQIMDTGIGIPEACLATLFERFSQVGPSPKGRQGTGLGLSISKSLVDIMGGKLRVESVEGVGSTFWFTVPLPGIDAPKEIGSVEPALRPPLASDRDAGSQVRILVVDDVEINRQLTRTVLESLGHGADLAADGHEALGRVRQKDYDLVLMDIQMPDMDGIETTRLIRALETPARNVLVFAMTANVLPHQVDLCAQAGMDGFIAKPFRRAELASLIERVRTAPASARPSFERVGHHGFPTSTR